MATDNEINQIERRAELAVKVATLEERSVQNQSHLTRIESMLVTHATDEEQMLRDINTSLQDFKDEIGVKIEHEITPIKEDLAKYKGILAFIGSALGILFTGLAMFKDEILAFFKH
jgi:hypothetical protein